MKVKLLKKVRRRYVIYFVDEEPSENFKHVRNWWKILNGKSFFWVYDKKKDNRYQFNLTKEACLDTMKEWIYYDYVKKVRPIKFTPKKIWP